MAQLKKRFDVIHEGVLLQPSGVIFDIGALEPSWKEDYLPVTMSFDRSKLFGRASEMQRNVHDGIATISFLVEWEESLDQVNREGSITDKCDLSCSIVDITRAITNRNRIAYGRIAELSFVPNQIPAANSGRKN